MARAADVRGYSNFDCDPLSELSSTADQFNVDSSQPLGNQ